MQTNNGKVNAKKMMKGLVI